MDVRPPAILFASLFIIMPFDPGEASVLEQIASSLITYLFCSLVLDSPNHLFLLARPCNSGLINMWNCLRE